MLLPLFGLTACLINDAVYEQRKAELADADNDGSLAEFDCNDHDSSQFPGADETCNGRDDDCDGEVDESAIDRQIWYIDGDGDGDGTTSSVAEACQAPTGYANTGTDCDDTRADVFPGGTEVPYNNIDEDCTAGDLVDVDGDGANGMQSGGLDCDDNEASKYPGASEICFDDLDQDCDGQDFFDCDLDGFDSAAADGDDCDDDDATVYPAAAEDWHDLGLDNDCDGQISDQVNVSLAGADVVLEGPDLAGYFGGGLGTFADADGDGLREVWIASNYDSAGGSYSGAVYILSSIKLASASGSLDVDANAMRITGNTPDDIVSGGVSDGQIAGVSRLWISAPGENLGAGYIYSVPTTGVVGVGSAAISSFGTPIVAGDEGAFIGFFPIGDHDLDGDGQWDLAIDALGLGPMYIYSAPDDSLHALADADFTLSPDLSGHWLAPTRTGDVNDDGYDDLGVVDPLGEASSVATAIESGGPTLTSGVFGTNAAIRLLGSLGITPAAATDSGERLLLVTAFQASVFVNPAFGSTLDPLSDADYQLFRTTTETGFTTASAYARLGSIGPAYLLGGPDSDDGSARGDCVVWQSNEFANDGFAADTQLHFTGESAGDRACHSVAVTDDYNADGNSDLLIGAPLNDQTAVDVGRVYLQYSP